MARSWPIMGSWPAGHCCPGGTSKAWALSLMDPKGGRHGRSPGPYSQHEFFINAIYHQPKPKGPRDQRTLGIGGMGTALAAGVKSTLSQALRFRAPDA